MSLMRLFSEWEINFTREPGWEKKHGFATWWYELDNIQAYYHNGRVHFRDISDPRHPEMITSFENGQDLKDYVTALTRLTK